MKLKTLAITSAVIGCGVAGLYLGLFIAAGLYFLFIKVMPESVDSNTFLALWSQLSGFPEHKKKLQAAAVGSGLIVYLAPLMILSALSARVRPLHGNARFAHPGEVRKAGLNAEKGIIVGKYNGDYLVFGGQQFVLLAAPTRSGKGVGVVIPNLLNWPDSVVVLDIKLENFEKTSGFRAKNGQEVYLFSPFAEDFKTHRWNPLSAINSDPNFRVGDIQAIAATFYPSGSSAANNTDPFFNEQAQNLFLGIVLYLLETPELPCTLGEVLRQGSGCGQPVEAHLKAVVASRMSGSGALSPICTDALNRFLSNTDKTLASIKASFDAPLLIFANPIVDAATSGDDFSLRDVRRKRMSIYVGIQPNRLDSAARLLNVFFAQLVNLNTDKLPEHDPALKFQCLLIPDEFTAMGRIAILAKSVAFLAGYGLRLLPIVQSTEQLEETYGKDAARNFIKNHDLRIVFPPDDIEDAEKVSRTLGYLTEKVTGTGQSRSAGGWGKAASVSRSENVSDQKRALLLAQEVREMPQDQQIILKTNCKPILAQKIRYYKDTTFTARLLPPISVPGMDMDHHHAVTERRTRAVTPDEVSTLDLSRLALDTEAITAFSGDPEHPSPEEAAAVVDSFFAQLGWEDEPQPPPTNQPPKPTVRTGISAGRIDLSLLET